MALLYFTKSSEIAVTTRDRLGYLWRTEFHAVANQLNNQLEWGQSPARARVRTNKTFDDQARHMLYTEIKAALVEAGYSLDSDTFSLKISQPWYSAYIRADLVL